MKKKIELKLSQMIEKKGDDSKEDNTQLAIE